LWGAALVAIWPCYLAVKFFDPLGALVLSAWFARAAVVFHAVAAIYVAHEMFDKGGALKVVESGMIKILIIAYLWLVVPLAYLTSDARAKLALLVNES
jgi:hypothetical protein